MNAFLADTATRAWPTPVLILSHSVMLAYDHGDHLHPGDVGYKAMGDSIDLKLFTSR